jgi:hypothetical protein
MAGALSSRTFLTSSLTVVDIVKLFFLTYIVFYNLLSCPGAGTGRGNLNVGVTPAASCQASLFLLTKLSVQNT